jgi:hypothetical protein
LACFSIGRGQIRGEDQGAKVASAFKGVIFVEENGEGPGVRLRKAAI